MNKWLNISQGLIVVLYILSSCAAANKEEQVVFRESLDASLEVDEQFSSEQLERGNLVAFESRAKEKLLDFFNYLALIADPNYDTAFKNHAINLASELFVDDNAQFPIHNDSLSESVDKILNDHLEDKMYGVKYKVRTVNVLDKLSTIDSAGYSGMLEFTTVVKQKNQPDHSYTGQVAIKAIKIEKYFGKDKREVWEVFLGN